MKKSLKALSALLLFLFISSFAFANSQIVRIGYYELDNFQEGAAKGKVKNGYSYEYFHKVSSYTGWTYEYVYGTWAELYEMLLAGEIDILPGLSKTEDRMDKVLFPDIEMGRNRYSVYKHMNDITMERDDPESLKGKRIGVIRNTTLAFFMEDWAKESWIDVELVYYDDFVERNRDLALGNLDCITFSDNNLASNSHLIPLVRIGESKFYLSVSKTRPDLLKELNSALHRIDDDEPYYLLSLQTKYADGNLVNNNISEEEYEWLQKRNVIRFGYMDNYLPYSDTLVNGEVTGILKDVTEEIIKQLPVDKTIELSYSAFKNYDDMLAQLRNGNLDVIFPAAGGLYQSEKDGVVQSEPVVTSGMYLVFQGNYSEEKVQRIAINRNNKMQSYYIASYFPDAEIIECSSIEDCLYHINYNKADSTILNSLRASSIIKNSRYNQFQMIQLSTPEDKCFAVRSDSKVLLKLLNRGLNMIGSDFALNCSYKYSDVIYNYSLLEFVKNQAFYIMLAMIAVVGVILFFLVRDRVKTRAQLRERTLYRNEIEKAQEKVADANEEIKQKETIYSTIKKLINCGMWQLYFDEVGNVTTFEWGPEVSRMLGFDENFKCYNPVEFWNSRLHPDDVGKQTEIILDLITGKKDDFYNHEYRLLTNDRGFRWFRSVGDFIWNDDGTPLCLFGIILDVTDEKDHVELEKSRNEALERANKSISAMGSIYDALGAGQWISHYNKKGDFYNIEWSDKFRRLIGFTDSSDFPNSLDAYVSRIHPEDRERCEYRYMEVKNDPTGYKAFDMEFRVLTKKNEFRWFRSAGRFLRRNDGTPEILYGLFMDVDEKIKNNIALTEALAAAEHANRAKTVFLNNMSHDIRTPMNAIIGFTSLAASHLDNQEQVRDYLAKISTSSNHLLSLINDVLDMSRIESGTVKIDAKPLHLPEFLHDLRTIVHPTSEEKNLDFYIDTIGIQNEDIIADRLRLNQILINILGNAIKFTKQGGSISLKVIQKPAQVVDEAERRATYEFRIKDTGIGMSKEFQKHIFEPFTREESSTVSGIQGTGLGMAITKNIVTMMNGDISLTSEVGKGTEFVVTLQFPVTDGLPVDLSVPKLKGLSALVADGDSNTCLSICKMLSEIGMVPEWTTSGKEAVLRAKFACEQNCEFNAYIIEWLLPDLNGIETVRQIRAHIGDSKPIIILTTYDWADIEQEAREAGVTAFCTKPMFLSELREILSGNYRESKEEVDVTPETFMGKNVLLVEDNPLNQEIANEVLTGYGFVVEIADDGDVAVEKILETCENGTEKYDLILMDIQMPRMNGYQATAQIRKIRNSYAQSVPIIAMTANAFDEDKKAAIAAGMNGHVAKPINMKELVKNIKDVIK